MAVLPDFPAPRPPFLTILEAPESCPPRASDSALRADEMTYSAIRCLAVPCAGLILLLSGCAGVDGGKQDCRSASECATNAPPVAAGHSEKPPEPTVQLASYATDPQPPPGAEPPPPSGEQKQPLTPEKLPPPAPNSGAGPNESVRQISLPSALAAVSGQNPQVAYVNARICESFAQAQAARVLWLPSIHAGLSYDNHGGPVQASNGDVSDQSRSALEAGLGMGATGAGAPTVPGVVASFRVADAIFQPRIADHIVAGRGNAATAVVHDLLLSVALAYVDLLRAFEQKAIAEETFRNAQQLADLTADFARTGQGSPADADRAEAELAVRRNDVLRAQESIGVASAHLAELLNLDAAQVLVPQEPGIVPLGLVPPQVSLRQLVAEGMSNRPELGESRELVGAAVGRLQREQYAPLVPSVLLGVSSGGFGGGPGDTIANYRDRFDFDAIAYWELRNLGCGDLAARNQARAQVDQARFRQVQVMDQVAREVVEAHVQVESRRSQIAIAEAGVQAAVASYQRNMERIRNAKGLPLEALQSIQALNQSRLECLRAVTSYNEAQFRLHRALGWPIRPTDLQPGNPTAADRLQSPPETA